MICQRSQLEPCHSRLQLGLVGGGFHQSNHRADRDRQESIVLQGEDEQLVEGVRALPSSEPGLRRLQWRLSTPRQHNHLIITTIDLRDVAKKKNGKMWEF